MKGVSGEVVILEEAAYCDQGLVNEVVVPLLSMQSSVLLCISTLLDGSNHYTKLIELRNEAGQKVFESIAITLVCDDCLRSEHPEKCTHKLAEVPRWISSQKVEVVRTILSEDPAMLLRESLGISADGSTKLYPAEDIEAFEKNKPEEVVWNNRDHRINVQHVFISVDPSGGGASAFSICSAITLHNGSIQVRQRVGRRSPQGGASSRMGSSCQSAFMTAQVCTNASGRWARLATNTGPARGSTRL